MRRFLYALSLLSLLAACAAPPHEEPTPDPEPTLTTCPDTIVIENFLFTPAACRVSPGTTVTFLNKDAVVHTATSVTAAFDSGSLEPGQSAPITFSETGDFPYYCTTHTDMRASITVD